MRLLLYVKLLEPSNLQCLHYVVNYFDNVIM